MCCFHSLYFFQAFDNKISEYGNALHVSYRKLPIRSQSKRNVRRQSVCLTRPYKYLRKEEKQKAKEKRKDIPN